MNSKEKLKYVSDLFYPLKVELYNKEDNYLSRMEHVFKITASTGKYISECLVSYQSLQFVSSPNIIVDATIQRLHHYLEKRICQDFLNEAISYNKGTSHIITSTLVDDEKEITILSPVSYAKSTRNRVLVKDEIEINSWKNIIKRGDAK